MHPDGQLEVTSGFHLHADIFSRILKYLANDLDSQGSAYQQLSDVTGMSKTQVKAFVQYGVHMQLLTPRTLVPTQLGQLILKHDPFFDQVGTLWLLHYLFAGNPLLVVWNYMCNAVLPSVPEIGKSEAADQFLPFVGRWSESSIKKNVRKELRAFFADYTIEIFAPLDYLREIKHNYYSVNRLVTPVPPLILYSTALIYRDRFLPGASSLEIPDLVYAEHSPGKILRQSGHNIRRGLNTLHEQGWLSIEAKANLDQVRFRSSTNWLNGVMAYWKDAA